MSKDPFSAGFRTWEQRFRAANSDEWLLGGEPTQEVMVAVTHYRQLYGDAPARALDLGAGEGRNALYLAQQGFDVLALDAAEAGLERIRQRAEAANLLDRVSLESADLRTYTLPEQVDLMVSAFLVHLLPEPYTFIEQWQQHTRPGGICVVSTRNRFDHDPPHYWFPQDFELKQLFVDAGWHVVHAREEDNWRENMGIHFRERAVVAVKR